MEKEDVYNISFDTIESAEDAIGAESKVWVNVDDCWHLYKYNQNGFEVGEVFVSKLCQELGLKCVKSRFAHGLIEDKKTQGCLTESYRTPDVVEHFSFETVQRASFARETCPEYIVKALEKYVGDSCEIDKNILQELKVMALFDYLIVQVDRHENNIEFLKCKKEDGSFVVKLAPMFDNGRCFDFANIDINEKFENASFSAQDYVTSEMQFMVMDNIFNTDNGSYCDVCFGIAIEILKNKELKELYMRLKKFDMGAFIDEFAEKTSVKINAMHKNRIIRTWNHRIEHIDNALKCLEDPEKRDEICLIAKSTKRLFYTQDNDLPSETNFYILYLYNKSKGSNIPLSEYMKQDREYCDAVQDWIDLKTDVLKKKNDFPLLRIGDMTRKDAKEIAKTIYKQRAERFSQRSKFISKLRDAMDPDVILLDLYQELQNIELGKSTKTVDEACDEFEAANQDCVDRVRDCIDKWIEYGDDFCSNPKLSDLGYDADKEYDEEVIDKYIQEHEKISGGKNSKSYLEWLEKVDKTDYAEIYRNSLGERGWN